MSDIARLAGELYAKAADHSPCKAAAYTDAAEMVEQAWHEHAHDGTWETQGVCRLCDDERPAHDHR